jgi:hypothetical protein
VVRLSISRVRGYGLSRKGPSTTLQRELRPGAAGRIGKARLDLREIKGLLAELGKVRFHLGATHATPELLHNHRQGDPGAREYRLTPLRSRLKGTAPALRSSSRPRDHPPGLTCSRGKPPGVTSGGPRVTCSHVHTIATYISVPPVIGSKVVGPGRVSQDLERGRQ